MTFFHLQELNVQSQKYTYISDSEHQKESLEYCHWLKHFRNFIIKEQNIEHKIYAVQKMPMNIFIAQLPLKIIPKQVPLKKLSW